jgi:uncharacterized membrane protein YbhN (UPF0104 family)
MLGFAFFIIVLSRINFKEFQMVVVNPVWGPLIIMIIVSVLVMLTSAIKCWVLCYALVPFPLSQFIRYYFIASSIGSFTPASLGIFSMTVLMKKSQVPIHKTTTIVAVDQIIQVGINVVLFLPLTILLLAKTTTAWWIIVLSFSGILLMIAMMSFTFFKQYLQSIVEKIRFLFIRDCLKTIFELVGNHPLYLMANISLALLRGLIAGIGVYFALLSAGENANIFYVIIFSNSVSLLNLIPVSVSGLGVYEGSLVSILGYLGNNRERVFAGLVFQRLYIIFSSLFFICFFYLKFRVRGNHNGK